MSGPDSMFLVKRAQQGDSTALDDLLRRHLGDLRVFVRAKGGPRLRERESASDLVQTVCKELLLGIDRFEWRGEGSFRRWMFGMAINKIRNRADFWQAQRRDAARDLHAGDDASGEGALAAAYAACFGPSQHAIANEAIEHFERCLDELDEPQREVILMARVVGMSHPEIAAELGIEQGAVRTRLSRALARLATRMDAGAG